MKNAKNVKNSETLRTLLRLVLGVKDPCSCVAKSLPERPISLQKFYSEQRIAKKPFLDGHQFILDNRIIFNVICLPHLKIPFWKAYSKSDGVQGT